MHCLFSWKIGGQGNCQIAYREITKLFCSLAQFIGINPIASLYLSTETSFNIPWNRFIASIRSSYNQFSYALSESTAFREPLFREECVKSVASFKRIYDSQIKSLDFSRRALPKMMEVFAELSKLVDPELYQGVLYAFSGKKHENILD